MIYFYIHIFKFCWYNGQKQCRDNKRIGHLGQSQTKMEAPLPWLCQENDVSE